MATLVLGAIGTLIGGPVGGAIGALAGRQVDQLIIGTPRREGPRLKELALTTSSYGSAIPRHHGRMRVAGSIIWATDLKETSEQTGGGKGQPSVKTYSYSASFAVALSSRPIAALGRIWADGNLLRGAAGDLKAGGTLRVYCGYGDHPVDPLIAADKGSATPAFRNLAYAVFEDLQLADFGNRIPALTFEIIADEGEVALTDILSSLPQPAAAERSLADLQGFSLEGGRLADTLATIGAVYPIALDAAAGGLVLRAADSVPPAPAVLPAAASAIADDSFAPASGVNRARGTDNADVPDELRYYDVARDFQAGLQRADGRARPGRSRAIEFPGALAADTARWLVNSAAERASWARETIAWRMAELDPALSPGAIVQVPDRAGNWLITGWEWREQGIELELYRLPRGPARKPAGDAGTALPAADRLATPTALVAYELPWDGSGSGDAPAQFAAASSSGAGWSGAALYADHGGALTPLGGSGTTRSIIGSLTAALLPSPAVLLERAAWCEVQLVANDLGLSDATAEALATGANRALVGSEVIQFARVEALGGGAWRLSGLLRGRGGTEAAAQSGHGAGTRFVLLDGKPLALDPALVGESSATSIVALGVADLTPVSALIANPGLTRRPLVPVHPTAIPQADGGLLLGWTRRARGAWNWPDEVETALGEQAEAYLLGLGPVAAPALRWELSAPALLLDGGTMAMLGTDHAGAPLWVRQVGNYALSDPLLLATIA